MSDRADATITIGGPLPATRLDELLDTIEAEHLGSDWDEYFASRENLLAFLQDGATGVTLYGRQRPGGEIEDLQAFCVEVGLTYVLTYDGYGCEWAPARRIRRPGDAGEGRTCGLNVDGGVACVTAHEIHFQELGGVKEILEHLARFDDPHVPPLEIIKAVDSSDAPEGPLKPR